MSGSEAIKVALEACQLVDYLEAEDTYHSQATRPLKAACKQVFEGVQVGYTVKIQRLIAETCRQL